MSEVEALVGQLRDGSRAVTPAEFLREVDDASDAGLYAWFADEEARKELAIALGVPALEPLIYVGQAGATKQGSGAASAATLKSRIGRNHLGGNVGSSTFRKTLAALLREPLDLACDSANPKRLAGDGNVRLSEWMSEHLRVAIVPFPDRARLATVEVAVVAELDPPLNLDHVPSTASRSMLRHLRKVLVSGDVAAPAPNFNSDSSVQQEAERAILNWVGMQVKARLDHRVISLPGGTKVDVDGFSERPLVLVEAFARQGALLGGQRHKVAGDVLKLITVQRLVHPTARVALAFGSAEAAAWVQGNSWLGESVRAWGVEVYVAQLDDDLVTRLRAAQVRQKMVNAPDEEDDSSG